MKEFAFKTKGVCARQIYFTIDQGLITGVRFDSGCDGNLQGISRLVEGMPVSEVIKRLRGISCEGKATSCPDQLAQALENLEVLNS
ncbi:MAG TPA: TIGR03905 family TSCPD domain-containing protein [Bacillota bacterium]|nr:TIGR03905 family TSCPD domain-containing protein [Bacillota bacterium]